MFWNWTTAGRLQVGQYTDPSPETGWVTDIKLVSGNKLSITWDICPDRWALSHLEGYVPQLRTHVLAVDSRVSFNCPPDSTGMF